MKKRVLFVINTLGHAGAEVAMLELLRQLGQRESFALELYVYVLLDQGELAEALPQGVTLCNRSYSSTGVFCAEGRRHQVRKVLRSSVRHASLFRNLPYLVKNGMQMLKKGQLQADKLLWRVIADGADVFREEFDLAVAYLEGGATYYVADHVRAKKKAAFVHIDYPGAGYTRSLDGDCYRKFDRIFAVSGRARRRFLSVHPECRERTEVFYNLLDGRRIEALSRQGDGFADGFDGFRILSVGRLVAQKDYETAIRVMKLLKEDGHPVRWHVLGEGPMRRKLEKQIAVWDLTADFVLEGHRANPYPYFAQADLYVQMSRFEGKSIAIEEAQILGLPVIASDAGADGEQITNRVDGILCERSPEKIRDEIVQLMQNPGLRSTYVGRARHRQDKQRNQMGLLLDLL